MTVAELIASLEAFEPDICVVTPPALTSPTTNTSRPSN